MRWWDQHAARSHDALWTDVDHCTYHRVKHPGVQVAPVRTRIMPQHHPTVSINYVARGHNVHTQQATQVDRYLFREGLQPVLAPQCDLHVRWSRPVCLVLRSGPHHDVAVHCAKYKHSLWWCSQRLSTSLDEELGQRERTQQRRACCHSAHDVRWPSKKCEKNKLKNAHLAVLRRHRLYGSP